MLLQAVMQSIVIAYSIPLFMSISVICVSRNEIAGQGIGIGNTD